MDTRRARTATPAESRRAMQGGVAFAATMAYLRHSSRQMPPLSGPTRNATDGAATSATPGRGGVGGAPGSRNALPSLNKRTSPISAARTLQLRGELDVLRVACSVLGGHCGSGHLSRDLAGAHLTSLSDVTKFAALVRHCATEELLLDGLHLPRDSATPKRLPPPSRRVQRSVPGPKHTVSVDAVALVPPSEPDATSPVTPSSPPLSRRSSYSSLGTSMPRSTAPKSSTAAAVSPVSRDAPMSRAEALLLDAIRANPTPIRAVSLRQSAVSEAFVTAVATHCRSVALRDDRREEQRRAAAAAVEGEMDLAERRGVSLVYLKNHAERRRCVQTEERTAWGRIVRLFKKEKRHIIECSIVEVQAQGRARGENLLKRREVEARDAIVGEWGWRLLDSILVDAMEVDARSILERTETGERRKLWARCCENYDRASLRSKMRRVSNAVALRGVEVLESTRRSDITEEQWNHRLALHDAVRRTVEAASRADAEARTRAEEERRRVLAAAQDAEKSLERHKEVMRLQAKQLHTKLRLGIAALDRELTRVYGIMERANAAVVDALRAVYWQHESFAQRVSKLHALHRSLGQLFAEAPKLKLSVASGAPIAAVFQPSTIDLLSGQPALTWTPVGSNVVAALEMDNLWQVRLAILAKELQRQVALVEGSVVALQDECFPLLGAAETARRQLLACSADCDITQRRRSVVARAASVDYESSMINNGVLQRRPDATPAGSSWTGAFRRYLRRPVDFTAIRLDLARCVDVAACKARKLTLFGGSITAQLTPPAARCCCLRYAGDWTVLRQHRTESHEAGPVVVAGAASVTLRVPLGATIADVQRQMQSFHVACCATIDSAAVGELLLECNLRTLKIRSYLGCTGSRRAEIRVRCPLGVSVHCRNRLHFLLSPALVDLAVGSDRTDPTQREVLQIAHDARSGPLPLLSFISVYDPPAVERVAPNSTKIRMVSAAATGEEPAQKEQSVSPIDHGATERRSDHSSRRAFCGMLLVVQPLTASLSDQETLFVAATTEESGAAVVVRGRDVFVNGFHSCTVAGPDGSRNGLVLRFVTHPMLDGVHHVWPVLRSVRYANTSIDPVVGRRVYRITASSDGGVRLDIQREVDIFVTDPPAKVAVRRPVVEYPRLYPRGTPEWLIRAAASGDKRRSSLCGLVGAPSAPRYLALAEKAIIADTSRAHFRGGSIKVSLAPSPDIDAGVVKIGLHAVVASRVAYPVGLCLVSPGAWSPAEVLASNRCGFVPSCDLSFVRGDAEVYYNGARIGSVASGNGTFSVLFDGEEPVTLEAAEAVLHAAVAEVPPSLAAPRDNGEEPSVSIHVDFVVHLGDPVGRRTIDGHSYIAPTTSSGMVPFRVTLRETPCHLSVAADSHVLHYPENSGPLPIFRDVSLVASAVEARGGGFVRAVIVHGFEPLDRLDLCDRFEPAEEYVKMLQRAEIAPASASVPSPIHPPVVYTTHSAVDAIRAHHAATAPSPDASSSKSHRRRRSSVLPVDSELMAAAEERDRLLQASLDASPLALESTQADLPSLARGGPTCLEPPWAADGEYMPNMTALGADLPFEIALTPHDVLLHASGLFDVAPHTATDASLHDQQAAATELRLLVRQAHATDAVGSTLPVASRRLAVALLQQRHAALADLGLDESFLSSQTSAFRIKHYGNPMGTVYLAPSGRKLVVSFDRDVIATDALISTILDSLVYSSSDRDPCLLDKVMLLEVDRPGLGTCATLRKVVVQPYDDPTEINISLQRLSWRGGATGYEVPAIPTPQSQGFLGLGSGLGLLGANGAKNGKVLRLAHLSPPPESPPQLASRKPMSSTRPTALQPFHPRWTSIVDPDTAFWDGGFVEAYARESFLVDLCPTAALGLSSMTSDASSSAILPQLRTAADGPASDLAESAAQLPQLDSVRSKIEAGDVGWLRSAVGRCSCVVGSYVQLRLLSVAEQQQQQLGPSRRLTGSLVALSAHARPADGFSSARISTGRNPLDIGSSNDVERVSAPLVDEEVLQRGELMLVDADGQPMVADLGLLEVVCVRRAQLCRRRGAGGEYCCAVDVDHSLRVAFTDRRAADSRFVTIAMVREVSSAIGVACAPFPVAPPTPPHASPPGQGSSEQWAAPGLARQLGDTVLRLPAAPVTLEVHLRIADPDNPSRPGESSILLDVLRPVVCVADLCMGSLNSAPPEVLQPARGGRGRKASVGPRLRTSANIPELSPLLSLPPPTRPIAVTPLLVGPSEVVDFPAHSVRLYTARAAIDGKAEYLFPPSVAFLIAPSPDSSIPAGSSFYSRPPLSRHAAAASKLSATIDAFIGAGAGPKDRLLFGFADTEFVTTADGLIVWGKEPVCRCVINAPHHIRIDMNRDVHRGATRGRLERLLQCLQFVILASDTREAYSAVSGPPRTVVVVISELNTGDAQTQSYAYVTDALGRIEVTTLVAVVEVGDGSASVRSSVI